jgi:hypothetical protein
MNAGVVLAPTEASLHSLTACVTDARAGTAAWPRPASFLLTAQNTSRESAAASGEDRDRTRVQDGAHALFAVVGPGVLAGLSDDDPAGITTYSILGAKFGYRLLWVLAVSDDGADRLPRVGRPDRRGDQEGASRPGS